MKKSFLFLALFLLGTDFLQGKSMADNEKTFSQTSFQSSENQTQLLELYTSEGCSSCPPADEWLSRLKNNPDLWKKYVPVAFHVDYWDYLGWKDQLAKPEFSKRQRSYSSQWNNPTIYTPGFVLNGEEWLPAKKIPESNKKTSGILKAEIINTGNLVINYFNKQNFKNLEINIALSGSEISNKIKAGENGGRTLTHYFAVLDYKKVNMKSTGNYYTAETKINVPGLFAPSYSLAVWVNSSDDLTPLQSVGGNLTVKK
jgi:hypothetical protein